MKQKHAWILAGAIAGLTAGAAGISELNSRVAGRCHDLARAVVKADEAQAEAEFWLTLAGCLNDPTANLPACWRDAAAERDAAEDEADERLQARLALCNLIGPGVYDPQITPADFSADVTNPWLPFVVGRTLVYEKMTPDGLERLTVQALNRTVDLGGVSCRAVRAVETLAGVVKEDTEDWFAQHVSGEVWYFGEIVLNYEDGFLEDLGGSWRYGKGGALPGRLMLAAPAAGAIYRQEFSIDVAEDVAEVLATGLTITVPAGTFANCIKTRDGSPMEPSNFEWKYYAPGVGLIAEEDPQSGERLELVQIL